jgi:RTX calcium-binding nonapeptide repeat (4 copies)/Beta-propeller repeat
MGSFNIASNVNPALLQLASDNGTPAPTIPTRDDGLTSILTPASDVVFGGLGSLHISIGRLGNDVIYAYNHGFNKQDPNRSDLDILLGDIFDINGTVDPAYRDDLILQNPLLFYQYGPPSFGSDTFVLGDWLQPYYTNTTGNPFELLSSDFFGFKEYALIFDFNPQQDVIRLHGKPENYLLFDINGFDAPQLGGQLFGKAIFSLQQGIPDIVGFLLTAPGTTLNLNDNYFQYVGNTPPLGPVQSKFKQLGTDAIDLGLTTATDLDGNVYVGGMTSGSLQGTNIGSYDAWIAKYDNNGKELWHKQFGTSNYDVILGIDTDKFGNVYLEGSTEGDLFAPRKSLVSDFWVAKLDSNGNQLWGKQFGTNDYTISSRDIDVDDNENVSISGVIVKQNTRPDLFNSPFQDDAFVTQYDSNGNQKWFKEIGNFSFDESYGVALDRTGNTYTAGWTYNLIKPAIKYDVWLNKSDPNGQTVWTQQFGTDGFEFAWDTATDSQGNIYITGWTTGDFEGKGNNPNSSYDVWLAKFLPDGTQSWIRQFGSQGDDASYLAGMTIDANDNIFLAGYTNSNLGGSNAGSYDGWVASYDAEGNQRWLQQFGTPQLDYATDVTVDNKGHLFVTGFTEGSLGAINAGAVDTWVAKLNTKTGKLKNFNQSNDLSPFTPNDDVVMLTEGNDFGDALAGSDRTISLAGDGTLYGNLGNDTIYGGEAADVLNGNQSDDILHGGKDSDLVRRGKGNDQVFGDLGDDTLWGDLGNDTLTGGEGSDRFILSLSGTDTILDLQFGQDLLTLSGGSNFGALSSTQGIDRDLISVPSSSELLATITGIPGSNLGMKLLDSYH